LRSSVLSRQSVRRAEQSFRRLNRRRRSSETACSLRCSCSRNKSRRTSPLPAEAWRDPRRCQAPVARPRAPAIRRAQGGLASPRPRRAVAFRHEPRSRTRQCLAPQPRRLACTATSKAACPAAVPGIASNRGGRCRCRPKHGAIRGDARPPSLAPPLPKFGPVARPRAPAIRGAQGGLASPRPRRAVAFRHEPRSRTRQCLAPQPGRLRATDPRQRPRVMLRAPGRRCPRPRSRTRPGCRARRPAPPPPRASRRSGASRSAGSGARDGAAATRRPAW
jgi:hypothetical protein